MTKVIFLVIGSGLLIVSVVIAMQMREFVKAADSIEGKVFSGDSGKRATRKVIEFWIKHSDYTEPFIDLTSVNAALEQAEKQMEKLSGKPARVKPYEPLRPRISMGMPESVVRAKTHTRYTFVTRNLLPGIDREKVPVLYDPESLSKDLTLATFEGYELDSSHAMVNTFTSVYAYSLFTGIPGGLLFAGSVLVFLQSRFGGWRYFAAARTARTDQHAWIACPGCGVRFDTDDPHRWNQERHLSCGQRIRLSKLPQ